MKEIGYACCDAAEEKNTTHAGWKNPRYDISGILQEQRSFKVRRVKAGSVNLLRSVQKSTTCAKAVE